MIMTEVAGILERIRAEEVRMVDFRFTDLHGQWQHVAVAADAVGEPLLERGVMFDGSAVALATSASRHAARPATPCPTSAQLSFILICNVAEPSTGLAMSAAPATEAPRPTSPRAAWPIASGRPTGGRRVRRCPLRRRHPSSGRSEEGACPARYDVGNSGHRSHASALLVPPIDHG
jgi:glutamine synthetase